jgi:hypothetical protein
MSSKEPTYVHRGYTYYNAPNNSAAPDFFPIDSLTAVGGNTGDLILKAVTSNNILYAEPVDDPLYSAYKEVRTFDVLTLEYKTSYMIDYPLRIVGCTQHVC